MFVDRFVPSLICLSIDPSYEAVVVFKGRKRARSDSLPGVVESKRRKTLIGSIRRASPPDPSARGSKRARESLPEQETSKRLKVCNFSRPHQPMLRQKRKKLLSAAPTQSRHGRAFALGKPSNKSFTSVVSGWLDIAPSTVEMQTKQPTDRLPQALLPLLDSTKRPKGDSSAYCGTGFTNGTGSATGDGDTLSFVGESSKNDERAKV
jgi:hypothetical protein